MEISTWKLFYRNIVSMYPARILARINIIFPVFADRYVQRQLEKCTRRRSLSITVRHIGRSSDYLWYKMPMILWCA